jgi:hypothetical protein
MLQMKMSAFLYVINMILYFSIHTFFTYGLQNFLDTPPPCYEYIYQKKLTYMDVGRKAAGLTWMER